MTEETNIHGRYLASCCAILFAVTAVVSTSLFSLNDSWVETRLLGKVALCVLAVLLFELGNSGKWCPQFSAPKGVLRGLLSGLVGISGFVLLLSAFGFCLAVGPGKYPRTTVGFIFGMLGSSLLLIRSAITGVWLPGSGTKKTAPPAFQSHLPLR